MKYYIIAGEASGDLHGAGLIRGLYAEDKECEVRFCGGDLMRAAGGTMVRHYRDTAVMGFVEVLGSIGRIARSLRDCKADILSWRPDAVILVDYPGFNLKIARFAHRHGFKVFYYIAPKVWARGEGRLRKLRKYVDMLYIIFPFEIEYFRKKGVEARYYGNPLLDAIAAPEVEKEPSARPSLALLPGSRRAELKFLMPRIVKLERLLSEDRRFDDFRLVVAGAPSMKPEDYAKWLPPTSRIEVVFGRTYSLFRQSAAAVVCSGTASLEAALIGTPQVVCYGFNRITYLIARLLVRGIKYISLANLILDKPIFKELIQKNASPEEIYSELCTLVFDNRRISEMKDDYRKLNEIMGGEDVSRKIAKDIHNEITLLQISGSRQ